MEPTPQPPTTPDQPDTTEPALPKQMIDEEQIADQPYFNEEAFTLPESESVTDNTAPAATPVTTPKKKSLLWLWLTLSTLLLVAGGLAVGLFVIKNAADAAAQTYIANVKSYLDDVYDAATTPADNPSDVKKAVEVIAAPTLESALLGEVSSEYVAAGKLHTKVAQQVAALTTKLAAYAQVYVFYKEYKNLYSELNVLDSDGIAATTSGSKLLITAYLVDFRDALQEVQTFLEKATVPDELSADVKNLEQLYGDLHTHWGAMADAFGSSNSTAYDTAYDQYVASSSKLDETELPIIEFYNNLSSKTHDSAKELAKYTDTIK